MEDACGCGGGAAAEIVFLEEGHFQTAQCSVSGDAGADDSTADDDQIESHTAQLLEPVHGI